MSSAECWLVGFNGTFSIRPSCHEQCREATQMKQMLTTSSTGEQAGAG